MPTKIIRHPDHAEADEKTCAACARTFRRDPRYSKRYFAAQKYCCQRCSADAFSRRNVEIYGSAESRFWSRVRKEPSGCWKWTGSTNSKGYGVFSLGGKRVAAHRFALERFGGGLSSNKLACHTCDNPLCVNPGHLYAGDYETNGADAAQRQRFAHQKLTPQDAFRILTDARPNKDIAKEFGVSASMVCAIKKRRKWRWLENTNAE